MVASSQPLGSTSQKSGPAEGARLRLLSGLFLGGLLGLAAAAWLSEYAHLSAGRVPPGVDARAGAPLSAVSSMSGQGDGDRTSALGALATAVRLDVMAVVDRAFLRSLHEAGFAVVPAYGVPVSVVSDSVPCPTAMSFP